MATALFSSASTEWTTPRWLFDRLDAEFGFTLDAAATAKNALCLVYYTRRDDGLRQPWDHDVVWCNPPYDRRVGQWVRKGYEESRNGAIVVMLLAARTDTRWFHTYCFPQATEIRFIKGRLRFGDGHGSATFPSIVVVWDARKHHPTAFSVMQEDEADADRGVFVL